MANAGNAPEPTAARLQLGRKLRGLRERSGKGSVDVVARDRKLGISRAKLFRLEAGTHRPQLTDVRALGHYYAASPEELEDLLMLAEGSQAADWWQTHGPGAAAPWFTVYLSMEARAREIRTYQGELIPGLLQTQAYVAEVHRARNPEASAAEVEARIALRMERRDRVLNRKTPEPPILDVVLNEGVLRRQVGGPDVMADQIEQLLKVAERPNIHISVLPFAAGAHAAMETAFIILEFGIEEAVGKADPGFVYIENPSSAVYHNKADEIDRYGAIFAASKGKAKPIKEWAA
jgi:hypothetical protein